MENFRKQQLDIEFPEDKKEGFGGFGSKEEREGIARNYKSSRPEIFFKIDGNVFVKESDTSPLVPVKDWYEMEESLYSKYDDDEPWYRK